MWVLTHCEWSLSSDAQKQSHFDDWFSTFTEDSWIILVVQKKNWYNQCDHVFFLGLRNIVKSKKPENSWESEDFWCFIKYLRTPYIFPWILASAIKLPIRDSLTWARVVPKSNNLNWYIYLLSLPTKLKKIKRKSNNDGNLSKKYLVKT